MLDELIVNDTDGAVKWMSEDSGVCRAKKVGGPK